MNQTLLKLRYYLEIIAVPVFVWLVAHLSGHGLMILLESGYDHAHHHGRHEGRHGFDLPAMLEFFLTVEVLSGVLILLLFTWLWHLPALKKWVPCSHEHCHGEVPISHTLAIVALCLHFFPEAGVRHELFHGMMSGEMISILGVIGFSAHFFIDVIVALMVSSYWKTKQGFALSFGSIAVVWLVAFFTAEPFVDHIPTSAEGILFLMSAFLLAMFVHKPHHPVLNCEGCQNHH